MSKQKVVSSLLLSTVVLGGLAFYSTTTVKAESLEPDVTSVSASDATNKPVVPNEEESDFLAEGELDDDETLEEELNEQAEEVAEPSSPEALLQPRAMMSDSTNSDMEEMPVDDSDSVSEKIADTPLIQSSNADSKATGDDQAKIRASVSIESLQAERNKIRWQVTFDTGAWSFDKSPGGFYFILPEGLELTEIIDNDHGRSNIINDFPTDVNAPKNDGGQKYRFFSKEEKRQDDKNFDSQWGWSAEQANPDVTVQKWKSEGRFSKIYFIDKITDTTRVTYTLTAKVTASDQKSFPLMAVMKSFGYKNHSLTEFTSLGAREIILETPKETPLPPKEDPKQEEPRQDTPEAPNPDSGIILKPLPKPEVPQTPKEEAPKEEPKQEVPQEPKEQPKETPQESPTPEVPQVPDAPKDEPQVPSIPEEQPKETPTPEVPSTPEKQPEAPTEEPKKEDAPAPEVPSVPEEQPKETPIPEVPKQEDVQPEAPKSDKVESDKPMPETKQPDMKQPKADDMPKEQKPKADEPKAEQPQMDKPKMEAPKKDSESPKSDKVETDKPMPETKQPDVKQPKADDMPKEQQPKAEAPKAEQPQMEAPKKDSESPKSDKAETDKPMPETKQPDMKQPKADDMPKEQQPKAEAPKAEQPQMDKPQMEAPKKDSEAPKSDKAETDKPMPETKQSDMKQPKADKPEAEKAQMPRTEGMKPESKASMMPKAEASKATLPNTGEASSAIGWLGGALATLVTGLYLFKNKKE
ncbi:TPA: LPXTG cell wall anchor domain-containing protein [Streptococcus suis]|nr:LPXTG cell wall anchor domain-containing protein [Streptococcus suis]